MDIIQKFGNAVSSMSLEDPGKARRLLLTGYRLQEKRLLFFSDKKLPKSGQYVARIVMKNIIQALSKPENSAMVSIFVPGELLTAAGLTPYSVEAMSCFIAGTRCEQTFLRGSTRLKSGSIIGIVRHRPHRKQRSNSTILRKRGIAKKAVAPSKPG